MPTTQRIDARLQRVVSGGQTGVDRAALDQARLAAIEIGGWCPAGRVAEDGRIPTQYPLVETPDAHPSQRTEWNVRDSDGTLIVAMGSRLTGGTLLTRECAIALRKPFLVVDLASNPDSRMVEEWLAEQGISVLNVAGPRESQAAGIYESAGEFLAALFARVGGA